MQTVRGNPCENFMVMGPAGESASGFLASSALGSAPHGVAEATHATGEPWRLRIDEPSRRRIPVPVARGCRRGEFLAREIV